MQVLSVATNDFSSVKQTFMNDPDGGDADFSADIDLTATVNLTGLVSNSGSNAVLNGFQTDFVNELKVGDVVAIPSGAAGALEEFTVAASPAPTATALTLSGTPTNAVTSVTATRKRAQLVDQQKNILLRKLQKNGIKTLLTENAGGNSRTSLTFRRSFADTSTAGAISFQSNWI